MLILDAKRVDHITVAEDIPPRPALLLADDYWATTSQSDQGDAPEVRRWSLAQLKNIDPAHLSVIDSDGFCDWTLCTRYGIVVRECLMKRQPFLPLEEICSECYFADRAVDEMEPRHKRFLHYWWQQ